MLGIVFTEFVEMVETLFSDEVVDQLLENPELDSGGVFTAVGSYHHTEMIKMVVHLSELSGISVDDLVKQFGKHLFSRFHQRYPTFFDGIDDPLLFLEGIDECIHKQVLRLYPHAELPSFSYNRVSENELLLHYQSVRPFANLAIGLIEGCGEYFNQPLEIEYEHHHQPPFYRTIFTVRRSL